MKSDEEEPKQDKQADNLHRNQLVATALASCLLTLVLAAYLGAYSSADFENLSDWFAVIIAAGAAGISLYAVLLVAKTLKATQDTLKATQEMAADTKRIGDAQLRPWVLVEDCTLDETQEGIVITVNLHNYGVSPAGNFHCYMNVNCYSAFTGENEFYRTDGEMENFICIWNNNVGLMSYIGPNKPYQMKLHCYLEDYPAECVSSELHVKWRYYNLVSGEIFEDSEEWSVECENNRFFLA